MKERATLVVSGVVQAVGYRILAQSLAIRLGLKGLVKNLDNGTVKVVVEGERVTVDRFIEVLRIRQGQIYVKRIIQKRSPATGKFRTFRILRGKKDERDWEIISRLERGLLIMQNMHADLSGKQGDTHKAVKKVHTAVGSVRTAVGSVHTAVGSVHKVLRPVQGAVGSVHTAVKTMHKDINRNFNKLNRTYGGFGKTMKKVASDIHHIRRATGGRRKRAGSAT